MIYLSDGGEKVYNQEYPTWQGFYSDLLRDQNLSEKQILRVQHHQTSFIRKEGTSLQEKET